MGTLTAATLIDKAARLLLDVDNIKWSRAEMLEYLNEAQRQIVTLQPNANPTVEVVDLAVGSYQSLPAAGWALLDVFRNVGPAPTSAPGRPVRLASRRLLDSFDPDWHTLNAADIAQNYVVDPQDPTHFWVYPANTGRGRLQIAYAKLPAPMPDDQAAITVSDAYEAALVAYVLYRACSKVAPFAPGPDVAAGHLTAFAAAIGAKANAEAANSPHNPGAST